MLNSLTHWERGGTLVKGNSTAPSTRTLVRMWIRVVQSKAVHLATNYLDRWACIFKTLKHWLLTRALMPALPHVCTRNPTLRHLRCIHKCNHLNTLSSSTQTNRTMLWLQWLQVTCSQTTHVAVTHKICQIMSIRYVKFQWHQKDTDTHHSYYVLCSETTKQLAASHTDNSSPCTQLVLHTIRQDSCCACPLLAKQLFNLCLNAFCIWCSISVIQAIYQPLKIHLRSILSRKPWDSAHSSVWN